MYYTLHSAIKCSDGKVHRLTYDLGELDEESVKMFIQPLKYMDEHFPHTAFWIQQEDKFLYESTHTTEETFTWNKDTENKDSE